MSEEVLNMWRTTILLLFFSSIMLVHAATALADDDDDSTTSGDWWTLELNDRSENALGISPDEENRFGRQDCLDNITFSIDVTVGSSVLDGDRDLILYIGDDCDDDDEIDDCTIIADITLNSLSFSYENIAFTDIFGEVDCEDRETVYLWLADLEDEGIIDTASDDQVVRAATLIFDGAGPDTILEIDEVWAGDDNIEVEFDPSDSSSVEGYVAAYVQSSDANCADGTLAQGEAVSAQSVDGISVTWSDDDNVIQITGLENGKYYQVALSALDEYGNPSPMSIPVCAAPSETTGYGETLQTDGEYCFIATAAFGSYDHKTVRQLRGFRDHFLKHVPLGKSFIRAYYRVGPSLANLIEDDESRRHQVQTALHLLAGYGILLVRAGPHNVVVAVCLAVFMGLIWGVLITKKGRGIS